MVSAHSAVSDTITVSGTTARTHCPIHFGYGRATDPSRKAAFSNSTTTAVSHSSHVALIAFLPVNTRPGSLSTSANVDRARMMPCPAQELRHAPSREEVFVMEPAKDGSGTH